MKINEKNELLKLANRVKMLRNSKNLTQQEAYNDTGVHFGRIEQGKRDASYTTIKRISLYFNLTLEEFYSEGFD